MKPAGYRTIQSWYVNWATPGLLQQGGKIFLCGHSICDIDPTAKIILKDDLILGANMRRGSRAESYLKMKENSLLTVNGQFQVFFGASLELFSHAELTLGKSYINTGAAIACTRSISLGDGVFVARNVYITDSDHHKFLKEYGTVSNEPQPVHIGNHVLIGFGAIILKGVNIEDGAVVAAGAVVTTDVPAGCLVAGVPAKVIREGVVWK